MSTLARVGSVSASRGSVGKRSAAMSASRPEVVSSAGKGQSSRHVSGATSGVALGD